MKNFLQKKSITKIAILFVLLVVFVFPDTSLAQSIPSTANPGGDFSGVISPGGNIGPGAGISAEGDGVSTSVQNEAEFIAANEKLGAQADDSSICSSMLTTPLNCLSQWAKDTYAWFLYGVMTICAFLIGIAGLLLKTVMEYTVVEMSSRIGSLGTLNIAWSAFRDLANMFFIFILLYIAIETILDRMGGNTKKMLVRVVIIGLLINFSLFFTKIIIDGSNVVTIGFYNNILAGSTGSGGWEEYGLAGPFIDKMKLVGVYSKDVLATFGPINMTLVSLGGSLVMLVAAFMFLAISFLFIGRFVVLVFLMVVSPLAFASVALPEDKYSKMWWSELINQCLFAPVFLALLWVTIQLLDGILPKTTGNFATVLGGGSTPSVESLPIIMNFIVIITMLVFCLVAAKRLGATGASSVMKVGKDLQKWGQGKVGRGLVRATGIGYADRKFADTEFANSKLGRTIRSMSTGALTGQDFGSGRSVQKVDKENDKLDKEYAKKVFTNTKKAEDKGLEARRKYDLAEAQRSEPALELAKNTLKRAIADGKALPESETEKIKAAIKEGEEHVTAGTADAAMISELNKYKTQMATTERLATNISEHEKNIGKIKEIENRIKSSAKATEEEKKDKVDADGNTIKGYGRIMEARAATLEKSMGVSIPILSSIIKRIPADRVKSFIVKNDIMFNDVNKAIKTLRDGAKGKESASEIQEAFDKAVKAKQDEEKEKDKS